MSYLTRVSLPVAASQTATSASVTIEIEIEMLGMTSITWVSGPNLQSSTTNYKLALE